jgi:hypothetical protein
MLKTQYLCAAAVALKANDDEKIIGLQHSTSPLSIGRLHIDRPPHEILALSLIYCDPANWELFPVHLSLAQPDDFKGIKLPLVRPR